jgi:hypothetical protein
MKTQAKKSLLATRDGQHVLAAMHERTILVTGLVVTFIIGFLCFLPNLLNPQYFGLRHKSAKYYTDFTAACDSVLAEHPLGTNEAIWITVTDPSIPKIIRDLHPLKLQVNPQRVWMLMVSDSHAGFGLEWHRKWGYSNVWVLDTVAESLETDLYSTERSVPPNAPPRR